MRGTWGTGCDEISVVYVGSKWSSLAGILSVAATGRRGSRGGGGGAQI